MRHRSVQRLPTSACSRPGTDAQAVLRPFKPGNDVCLDVSAGLLGTNQRLSDRTLTCEKRQEVSGRPRRDLRMKSRVGSSSGTEDARPIFSQVCRRDSDLDVSGNLPLPVLDQGQFGWGWGVAVAVGRLNVRSEVLVEQREGWRAARSQLRS